MTAEASGNSSALRARVTDPNRFAPRRVTDAFAPRAAETGDARRAMRFESSAPPRPIAEKQMASVDLKHPLIADQTVSSFESHFMKFALRAVDFIQGIFEYIDDSLFTEEPPEPLSNSLLSLFSLFPQETAKPFPKIAFISSV